MSCLLMFLWNIQCTCSVTWYMICAHLFCCFLSVVLFNDLWCKLYFSFFWAATNNQVTTINCGNCHITLMYPVGAPSVKCAVCQFITHTGVSNEVLNSSNKKTKWMTSFWKFYRKKKILILMFPLSFPFLILLPRPSFLNEFYIYLLCPQASNTRFPAQRPYGSADTTPMPSTSNVSLNNFAST